MHHALGMLYCVLSAVAYTLMHVCQRKLSFSSDPVLVNTVQSGVAMSVLGVYLTYLAWRRRLVLPAKPIVAAILSLGFASQIGGTLYQWSLSVVGLSVGNSLNIGTLLGMSVVFGYLFLGEAASWRQILAIALITGAVFLFSHAVDGQALSVAEPEPSPTVTEVPDSAGQPPMVNSVASDDGSQLGTLGIIAACLAGTAFAVLTTGVRCFAAGRTSPVIIVFLINLAGVVILGPWATARAISANKSAAAGDYRIMVASGIFNLFGFLLVTKTLQSLEVARANSVTNALTNLLVVLAGITLFAEPLSIERVVAMSLMLVGVAMSAPRDKADKQTAGQSEA